jgi:hypothetical protein
MVNLEMPKKSKQLVGNMGIFYICYELSKRGWNCLPTTRNAKGIDLVIYSQNAKILHTIQVKSLSRKNPVPFGISPNQIADLVIICILDESPKIYILKAKEVNEKLHKGEKDGRISYWLQPHSYEEQKDCWDKIGNGFELD